MAFTLRLSADMEEQIALVQKKYGMTKSDTIKLLIINGLAGEGYHTKLHRLIEENNK
jgi:antitoxin component of RelBE/YafQ-DinJ toxin-antitoxin module